MVNYIKKFILFLLLLVLLSFDFVLADNLKSDAIIDFNSMSATELFNLGTYYFDVLDYHKAQEYYEKAAELNHAGAINNIGMFYLKGYGVPPNYEKAVEYFEKASKLGNLDATANLGSMYVDGKGVEKNFEIGYQYIEYAALMGNKFALHNLGTFYVVGKRVPKDYIKARQYFEQAANLGLNESMYSLACIIMGMVLKEIMELLDLMQSKLWLQDIRKQKNY